MRRRATVSHSHNQSSPARSVTDGARCIARHNIFGWHLRDRDVFVLLLAFRCLNGISVCTFFNADEYWQSLEVAHRLVFGYALLQVYSVFHLQVCLRHFKTLILEGAGCHTAMDILRGNGMSRCEATCILLYMQACTRYYKSPESIRRCLFLKALGSSRCDSFCVVHETEKWLIR
jgi:hypothetical protein